MAGPPASLRQPSTSEPYPAQGTALLLSVLFLEALLRPLLRLLARSLGIAANPWWLLALMCLLTLSALGLVLAFAKLAPAALGLRQWGQWSRTETMHGLGDFFIDGLAQLPRAS